MALKFLSIGQFHIATFGAPAAGKVLSAGKLVRSDYSAKSRVLLGRGQPEPPKPDVRREGPPQVRVATSKESSPAPFNTLFTKFKLRVQPFYNYYVEDEEDNETVERGNRQLRDLPRYVKLNWQQAPVTDKMPERKKRPPSNKRHKSSTLRVTENIRADIKRGIRFDRQSANKFAIVRKASINGFICPAVISSIVELPPSKAGFKTLNKSLKIDEIKYLKACCTDGISIHDIQANVNADNGILRAARIFANSKSKQLEGLKDDLFDGKFSISKAPDSNRNPSTAFSNVGGITIQGVVPDSTVMRMDLCTSNAGSQGSGKTDSDQLDSIMQETIRTSKDVIPESQFTEVAFVDPAITGLVSVSKVDLLDSPEHAENTVSLSQFMPNLCILSDTETDIPRKKEVPSFPATGEELGTEYVGYIIEKYRQGVDGVFTKMEEIEISDVNCTEYVDTRVLYGGVYRYRIKGLLRWTREGNVSHDGFEEGNFFGSDLTQTGKLAAYKSSYFTTEYGRKWQYAAVLDTKFPDPPDEFRVRPESHRKRVVITWKAPNNSQRDIYYYKLFRKLKNENGVDISEWEVIDVLLGSGNGIYYDNDVESFQDSNVKYVYAAQSITRHDEFSLLSCQIATRINDRYKFEGEFPLENISIKGVSLNAVGAFETCPIRKTYKDIRFKNKFVVDSRQGIHDEPMTGNTYCVRITSLDTAQVKDVVVELVYRDEPPKVSVRDRAIQVQPGVDSTPVNYGQSNISAGSSGQPSESNAETG
ncbi:MAG: hypothetical protein ACW99G_04150, partial [Candidatus Thorarchaeota archaeon]